MPRRCSCSSDASEPRGAGSDFARTSVETRAIYDFDHRDTIFEVTADRQLRWIHEDFGVRAQLQWFEVSRSRGSILSLFPNNSNASLAFRWDF